MRPLPRLLILGLLVAPVLPAHAAPLSAERAADALSTENMRCAAAYAAGLRCTGDRLGADATRDFRRARDVALGRAYAYGRKAGLADAALLARTDAAREAIAAEMRDCGGVTALLARHGRTCKALVQDPEARLRQLTTTGP